MISGFIALNSEAIEEFFNECHSPKDGKFCPGPDGPGRIREIKDPGAKKEAEKAAKELIRPAAKQGKAKNPVKKQEEFVKNQEKTIKESEAFVKKQASQGVDAKIIAKNKREIELLKKQHEREASVLKEMKENPKRAQDIKDARDIEELAELELEDVKTPQEKAEAQKFLDDSKEVVKKVKGGKTYDEAVGELTEDRKKNLPENAKAARAELEAKERAKEIRDRVKDSTDKTELIAAEDEIISVRDGLIKERELAAKQGRTGDQVRLDREIRKVDNELFDVREGIYDEDTLDKLTTNEEIISILADRDRIKDDALFNELKDGLPEFLNDENARIQAEARGKKFHGEKRQEIGQKAGEWPNPEGIAPDVEGREVKQISQAGVLQRNTVDGIKVKSAYQVTAEDGTKLRLYDLSSRKQEDEVEQYANSLAYLHEVYPQKPPKRIVLMSGLQASLHAPGAFAFVYPGTDTIYVNKKAMNGVSDKQWSKAVERDWFMPSGNTVPKEHYILTHEYGHQYDFSNRKGSARGMFDTPQVKKHLSTYGQSVAEEGYAEAFAEWHTSQGQTTNPAARAYAKHEKWHGYNRAPGSLKEPALGSSGKRIVRTPEGAKRFGVPVGSPIPEGEEAALTMGIHLSASAPSEIIWDPWEIARDSGIIVFQEDEEKEVEGIVKPPKDIPIVIDFWDGERKGQVKNIVERKATDEEKKEAEKVAREVFEELDIPWE